MRFFMGNQDAGNNVHCNRECFNKSLKNKVEADYEK